MLTIWPSIVLLIRAFVARSLSGHRVIVFACLALATVTTPLARGRSAAWTVASTDGPSPRGAHAMAYDTALGVTVLFGGCQFGTDGSYPLILNGETWEWNGTEWNQQSVSGPSPRYAHAMAYDSARGVTVLFGGATTGGNDGETWEWSGTGGGQWTQRVVSGPSPRQYHAMAYDAARGVVLLFGGIGGATNVLNDETWEWNGTTWTQRVVSGPSPRYGHTMAYDSAHGVIILVGGTDWTFPNSETWEWNGSAWTQRPVMGPGPQYQHGMAYDSAHDVMVVFGGIVGGTLGGGRTWDWDGTAWTQRPITVVSPRYLHAMVYDAARGEIVRFGGNTIFSSYCNGETWLLGGPCGSADFNRDGDNGTDADIEAFFACLGGNCCATCGSVDFNGDGDVGTDADIDAFFRVLAGGTC